MSVDKVAIPPVCGCDPPADSPPRTGPSRPRSATTGRSTRFSEDSSPTTVNVATPAACSCNDALGRSIVTLPMLACLDVSYTDSEAFAGCLLFDDWTDAESTGQLVVTLPLAAPYQPGAFYLRELPALLALLERLEAPLAGVVVDGYVWLGEARPGLGARLHDALGKRIPVVGVAKTAWGAAAVTPPSDACRSIAVCRGQSRNPLFVTAAGMDVADAAAHVGAMHGSYRLPTLLKQVDRLVRTGAARR